ncbi:MAG: hypothetical protein LIO99_04450 [Clostridiales bacterium]|nr:hypothetical protein [Clostridiales bacterium]
MKRKIALILAVALSMSITVCAEEENSAGSNDGGENAAINITMDDVIETDKFSMSFETFEIVEDFSIPTGENTSLSPSTEEGYQFALLQGHFESFSSAAIETFVFDISFIANGEYSYEDGEFYFASNNYFEIESLAEKDYYIYVKIPDNLVEIFETGTFYISFKDDLSSITTNYNYVDGETVATTDVDYIYGIDCTSLNGSEAAAGNGGEEAAADESATESVESSDTVENVSVGDDGKIHITMNDAIETDKFKMSFDSFEIVEDFSIPTGDNSSLSPSTEEGYQFALLKGYFENHSSSAIDTYVFDISFTANDEYSYEDGEFYFSSNKYFEIESLGEKEYYIYVKIPDNLVEIFATGVFEISFKDDLSTITTNYSYVDGETVETTDVDYTYALDCTSVDSGETALGSNSDADYEAMYATYGNIIDLLNGVTLFYNGGSDTLLNTITFSEKTATFQQLLFDGNGDHINATSECSYTVDDEQITVAFEDGSQTSIPYTFENDVLDYESGVYFTVDEVYAGLQGYWTFTYDVFGMTYETNLLFDGYNYTVEVANEGFDLPSGEYYYSGPYTGAYSINLGTLDFGSTDGNLYKWSFNIIGGEVVPLHYDHVCSHGSGLPGQYGYSFE